MLILADDLGSVDLHCYGAADLHTPHLDALAARGIRFTQFYVTSSVCSPSRAALLTGRYPQRTGVSSNAGRGAPGMRRDEVTLADMLRDAGYSTAHFGKWHLGDMPEYSPMAHGFDEFFGFKGGCIDNYSHCLELVRPPEHDLWRDDSEYWEDGVHFSDLITREAQRFVEANRRRPFFLYLAYNVPHFPLQAPRRHRRRYARCWEPRRSYAGAVSMLDAKVGEVLAKVDELGLREETLVIFLSDQGHSMEPQANSGGGCAGPYRGAKFGLFDGGLRVPCIASLPGRIPEAAVRDQLAASLDLFPTIAALCDVQLPERQIDGQSLIPILESATAPPTHNILHWQQQPQWAVREGDWKLIVNGCDTSTQTWLRGADRAFLSDISVDVSESRNLAASHPEVVDRLMKLHARWVTEVTGPEQIASG